MNKWGRENSVGDWAITLDKEHKEEVHGITSVPYAWRPGNLQASLHLPNSSFLLMLFCFRTLKPLILLQTGCSCVLAVEPSPCSLGGFFMLMEAPSSEDKTTANRIHCYSWFTKTHSSTQEGHQVQKVCRNMKAIWKPMGRWRHGDIFVFSFLLTFLILPSIVKCATGQTCFQMP